MILFRIIDPESPMRNWSTPIHEDNLVSNVCYLTDDQIMKILHNVDVLKHLPNLSRYIRLRLIGELSTQPVADTVIEDSRRKNPQFFSNFA